MNEKDTGGGHLIRWTYNGGAQGCEGSLTDKAAARLWKVLDRNFPGQVSKLEWYGPDGKPYIIREENRLTIHRPAPEYTGEW